MAEKAAKPANNEGAKYVERMETCDRQLDELKSEHFLKCKDVQEDKGAILDEAKNAGFTKASIKAIVKARELERKAKEAREDLDIADRDTFDSIRHSLGDLAELPLGQAAMESAANGAAGAAASV